MGNALVDFNSEALSVAAPLLLADRSGGADVVWACGERPREMITVKDLLDGKVVPRISKEKEAQKARVKGRGEVFTPAWVCNMMNNRCDDEWLGRGGAFNIEKDNGRDWEPAAGKVEFPDKKGRRWQDYVDSKRLEITCGEAPYLTSRYDAATGEPIAPERRIGLLDRKLRVAAENCDAFDEYRKWSMRALEASYGYEFQGDSLMLARANVFLAWREAWMDKLGQEPSGQDIRTACWRITWNLWQMDGLKGTAPYSELKKDAVEGFISIPYGPGTERECLVYDWRGKKRSYYNDLKKGGAGR